MNLLRRLFGPVNIDDIRRIAYRLRLPLPEQWNDGCSTHLEFMDVRSQRFIRFSNFEIDYGFGPCDSIQVDYGVVGQNLDTYPMRQVTNTCAIQDFKSVSTSWSPREMRRLLERWKNGDPRPV